jgi:hypothetical protein
MNTRRVQPEQIDHVETASIEDEAEPTLGMWIACACVFAAGAISVWYFF